MSEFGQNWIDPADSVTGSPIDWSKVSIEPEPEAIDWEEIVRELKTANLLENLRAYEAGADRFYRQQWLSAMRSRRYRARQVAIRVSDVALADWISKHQPHNVGRSVRDQRAGYYGWWMEKRDRVNATRRAWYAKNSERVTELARDAYAMRRACYAQ